MKRAIRTYHHGDLRAALLEAGLALLDAEGPDAVTVRGVARRAGVSHAAPANHFADRRHLLTALAVELVAALRRDLERALRKQAAPVPRLRAFAQAFIRFGLASPHRYRLLWRHDLVDTADPALRASMDGLYEALTAEIRALEAGDAYDADTWAVSLWSLVHGYVSLRIDGTFVPRRDTHTGEPREQAIVSAFLGAASAPGPKARRSRERDA